MALICETQFSKLNTNIETIQYRDSLTPAKTFCVLLLSLYLHQICVLVSFDRWGQVAPVLLVYGGGNRYWTEGGGFYNLDFDLALHSQSTTRWLFSSWQLVAKHTKVKNRRNMIRFVENSEQIQDCRNSVGLIFSYHGETQNILSCQYT